MATREGGPLLLIPVSSPLAIGVGGVRKYIALFEMQLLRFMQIAAVRMLSNLDVLAIIRDFPSRFELIMLTHAYHPSRSITWIRNDYTWH